MPKITNIQFTIAGKQYKCSVWYTATNKFFLKDFPNEVERVASIAPLGSATEEELYEKYHTGIAKYEELVSSCRKVIVFRISAAKAHVEPRYSKWSNVNSYPVGVDSLHSDDSMGFIVEHKIKLMRTVGDSFYLHEFDEEGKPLGHGNQIRNDKFYKVIDYTPEREAAFKELSNRFDKLFLAFVTGFDDAENFIDQIPTTKLLQG